MANRWVRSTMVLVAAFAAAALISACGGSSSTTSTSSTTSSDSAISTTSTSSSTSTTSGSSTTSTTSTTTDAAADTKVPVYFQPPRRNRSDQIGATLLKASKVPLVINSFAQGFDLPPGLKVAAVNGLGGGPFYNPKSNSITYQYGFTDLIYNTIRQAHPSWSNYQVGESVGAVNSFILAHEFTHALIANFDLPVLGREEDAADELASLILLRAQGGNQFLLDTADFWAQFSRRQQNPTIAAYADTHSLDLQRAFSMACDVAGSSPRGYAIVANLGWLPKSRLVQCRSEYKQAVDSFEQVLEPHTDGPLNLGK